MDNKDRLIKETAEHLGLTIAVVRAIVSSPLELASKTVLKNLPRSIYIRKVGTFISPQVRIELRETQLAGYKAKKEKRKPDEEDPIEFN